MRTAWDICVAVKDEGSLNLRDAVANILDTLKTDGSMKKLFAARGVTSLDALSAVAGKRFARDAN
jgi:hypothetical protein